MKKLNLLTILIMLAFATVSFGQITGSAHDFSDATTWNNTEEICITCHTPHNAMDVEPLWNHDLSVDSYTMYSSSTMTTGLIGTEPDGSSKLCLSCHDGTIALDNFGGNGMSPGILIGEIGLGLGDIGTDLSNDHPISFNYAAAYAADVNELHETPVGITFEGGMMQCSSCHDVHNGGPSGVESLLVLDNTGSALCLTCHNK